MGFFDSLAAAWSPTTVGESVRGVIENTFEKQQTGGDVQVVNGKRQFVPNNEPKFFKNGAPAMALVVVLRVAEETLEDNGQRAVYVNRPSRLFTAVAGALKEAGVKEPQVGDVLEVTYTGLDPESAQGNARMYSAKYEKGTGEAPATTNGSSASTANEAEVSAEAQALLDKLAALGHKPA